MDGFLAFYLTGALVLLGLFFATKYNEMHSRRSH